MTRNIVVPANNLCAASITSTDVDDGSFDPDIDDTITLSLDQSGPFGLGSHTVTLTATDNHGATNSSAAIVTVIDQTPPVITGAVVDKPTLWPPNHQMVDVAVRYTARDNCGPVNARLTVSSNEPVNGTGDGDTAPDWTVVDTHHVRLRAELSGHGIHLFLPLLFSRIALPVLPRKRRENSIYGARMEQCFTLATTTFRG